MQAYSSDRATSREVRAYDRAMLRAEFASLFWAAIMEKRKSGKFTLVGLAKARTESDFKATEVKSSNERIFIPNRKNPVPLLPHMPAYKLLTHIRDEAHRFAISYHRLLRGKRSLKSGE
jgi:excinuclease ABC subunit C